jgi:hypothetical protein
MRTLARRQTKVDESANPADQAVKGWKTFRGKARAEVLDQLQQMCSGLERCMYCEDSMATDIEHFRPKAVYPGVAYAWDNYLLACSHCNSNNKRDQFPVKGGRPLLVDPTAVDPFEHIALSPTTGVYVALDDVGAASIEVFGLNRDVCVNGRISAWTSLCALIRDFDQASEEGRARILTTVRNFPFQGVRRWMVSFLVAGDPADVVPADVREILARWPELAD